MKKFVIKCVIFLLLIGGLFVFILSRYGGYADYFYVKFTTPRQHSLILGDSRSMQGILPMYLNRSLDGFEKPIYNYSFTLGQIAYGPAYLKSIGRKISPDTKNGVFILNVSPWILSERESDNPQKGQYFETDMPPHNMECVDRNPNFEYVFRNFKYFHFKAIFRRVTQTHDDGWLEQQLPSDKAVLKQWKTDLLSDFGHKAQIWKPSDYRMKSLDSTVSFLSRFGKVYLVRMPIDIEVMAIENGFWPDFDQKVQRVAAKHRVPYFRFAAGSFRTYDGNHLDKEASVIFTMALGDSINKHSVWNR
jgi:hypothetical protein